MRLVPPPGSLHYQSGSMDLFCTKVHFVRRYAFVMVGLPLIFLLIVPICGSSLTFEHTLNCKCGGFPSLRHNELRDITANLLTEICPDVHIEPMLQSLSGEQFSYQSAITDDNARSDIAVSNF